MSLILFLIGLPQGGQGIPPEPEPEPEVAALAGGGMLGVGTATLRRLRPRVPPYTRHEPAVVVTDYAETEIELILFELF